MILVDANLLVYAHVTSFPQHERARDWLDSRFDDGSPVGLPWPSIVGFLRIATSPRVFSEPTKMADAIRVTGLWLGHESTWIPAPTSLHYSILSSLLEDSGTYGDTTMDADLAALAIEHGLILCSADSDFARFKRLRWENPLAR